MRLTILAVLTPWDLTLYQSWKSKSFSSLELTKKQFWRFWFVSEKTSMPLVHAAFTSISIKLFIKEVLIVKIYIVSVYRLIFSFLNSKMTRVLADIWILLENVYPKQLMRTERLILILILDALNLNARKQCVCVYIHIFLYYKWKF